MLFYYLYMYIDLVLYVFITIVIYVFLFFLLFLLLCLEEGGGVAGGRQQTGTPHLYKKHFFLGEKKPLEAACTQQRPT